MQEVWLHANKRVRLWAVAALGCVAVGGLMLALGAADDRLVYGSQAVGWLIAAVAGVACMRWATLVRRPRLAARRGALLVYLLRRAPIELPLDVVECFLLGQGPSFLPAVFGRRLETRTVVVRLAESAGQWHQRDIDPRLGSWCDGYVTLRGTWCEPLDVKVVNRLNRRLAEAHRAQEAAAVR